MARPPPKDWMDIAIDFFFGSAAADLVVGYIFLKAARAYSFQWHWHTFEICVTAAALIGGSMAALYRNQFWSGLETYSVIPPVERDVTRRAKVILWTVFGVGCASLGLLFV
jgi:hypothetical protein